MLILVCELTRANLTNVGLASSERFVHVSFDFCVLKSPLKEKAIRLTFAIQISYIFDLLALRPGITVLPGTEIESINGKS